MADKDRLQRVDMKAKLPTMSATDQHFIKKAEQFTMARGMSQKALRKRNLMVAGGLFMAVGAIYTWTMRGVNQEKFLDEYDDIHKK